MELAVMEFYVSAGNARRNTIRHRLVTDAIKRAEESPLPDPSSVTGGVFAAPEDLDTPHHK